MISETRKGRHTGRHRKVEVCAPASPASPASPRRPLEIQGGGIRRDRTSQLEKIRAAGMQKSRRHDETTQSPDTGARLSQQYAQASQDIASLASRLAQHNGLRKFSATFSSRAPPLELRMLLPDLEASIELLLASLSSCTEQIAELEVPPESRLAELRETVCHYLRSEYAAAQETFNEQRTHLRALRTASPLTSPVTMPVLPMKLSGVGSVEQSISSAAVSTQCSPDMPALELVDEIKLDEDSEVDEPALPFAAVMCDVPFEGPTL